MKAFSVISNFSKDVVLDKSFYDEIYLGISYLIPIQIHLIILNILIISSKAEDFVCCCLNVIISGTTGFINK